MSPEWQHAKQYVLNAHRRLHRTGRVSICALQIKYCWCAASRFSHNSLARFSLRRAEERKIRHTLVLHACSLLSEAPNFEIKPTVDLADVPYCSNLRSQLMIHDKQRTQHAEDRIHMRVY